jgi:hypothetical protein
MHTDWLAYWDFQRPPWPVLPAPSQVRDDTTRFVEQREDAAYLLVMSHVFTGPDGVRYHVGAAVDGPEAEAETLRKVCNDIRTQT